MKVTLLQLQRGAELSLQDDLEMEYRLSQRFVEDKDFYEGVRAGQYIYILMECVVYYNSNDDYYYYILNVTCWH